MLENVRSGHPAPVNGVTEPHAVPTAAPVSIAAPAQTGRPAPLTMAGKSGLAEAVGLLLLVGTLLAGSTVVAKLAPAAGWSPLPLLQWSLLSAALLQAVIVGVRDLASRKAPFPAAGRKRNLLQRFPGIAVYMLVSGILFAIPNALAFSAVLHVGAGFVALCFAFPLVFTYALAVFFKLEAFHALKFAGVLLGVTGGVAMVLGGLVTSPESLPWAVAALAMPVIIAAGNIYRSLFWPKGVRPAVLSSGMMAFGFLTLVPATLVIGEGGPIWDDMTGAMVGLLALQSGLFTLLYALYFRLQKLAGPVFLSQIGSVAAVVGLGLAYVMFAEVPDAGKIAAVGLVAAGISLVTWTR
ncbi:DMT family transporter [Roseibium sp.]|uniref:DMT family transporter n=1 Tax=Roseibium sp. TaxID=1936156 RepID=UPI003A97E0D7